MLYAKSMPVEVASMLRQYIRANVGAV